MKGGEDTEKEKQKILPGRAPKQILGFYAEESRAWRRREE